MVIPKAIAWLAFVTALLGQIGSASSIEVKCIEASKYKYIWKLFDGDKARFAESLQIGGYRLPDPEMCRAVLLTGTIGDPKSRIVDEKASLRELAQLAEAIRRNDGWLAEIYLSSPGGEIYPAMLLGGLVRTAWLKTRALDKRTREYVPDITDLASSDAARAAYQSATRRLRLIQVPAAWKVCGSACSAVHSAGVVRQGEVQVHQPAGPPGRKPKPRRGEHIITAEESIALYYSYLQFVDAGSQVIQKTRETAATSVVRAQVARYPRGTLSLARECGYDNLTSTETVGRTPLGRKDAPGPPPVPDLPAGLPAPPQARLQRAMAEGCFVGKIERARLGWFESVCPAGKCDIDNILSFSRVSMFIGIANKGDAVAQNEVGIMYLEGQIVPQDLDEASKWFRLAADQGNDTAEFALGVLSTAREGIAEDFVEAANWFRKAAEKGHAAAQYHLGLAYQRGEGVPQDHGKAVEWYRRAAEQRLSAAQNVLGFMYEEGLGVTASRVEALKWYLLAEDDEQNRDWATHNRRRLTAVITSNEIKEAERRARAWRALHGS